MAKFQIGIIGGGMVAQMHLKHWCAEPRVQVRWLAEINDQARAAVAQKFSIHRTTADYRQVLADPEVNAVVVCTPPSLHVRMGIDAMHAGKHLLMEKPLSVDMPSARRLVAAANERPTLKVSGCSARHARLIPKFPLVKKMIADGKLGRVYFIHHRAVARQGRGGIEYNPPAKWFLDRKIAGGGPLLDWGVYDLSFHLGVLDDKPQLQSVEAFCINGLDKVDPGSPTFTVEEHGGAFMTFTGGLRYFWERATNAHAEIPNQTTIYGTEGGLRFGFCSWDSPEIEYFSVDNAGRGKAQKEILRAEKPEGHDDMGVLIKAYVDCLAGQGPVPMPLVTELKNLDILYRVYAAAGW
jgi:predicted dehydrogenase